MALEEIARLALGWMWRVRPHHGTQIWAPDVQTAQRIYDTLIARHARN